MSEGKAQRDPTTGKTKRSSTTGKTIRNSATDSDCCCNQCVSGSCINCGTYAPATLTIELTGVTLCGCHGGHMLSGDPNGTYTLTRTGCAYIGEDGCFWSYYATPGPTNAQNWANGDCTGLLQENAQFYVELIKTATAFSILIYVLAFDGYREVIFTADFLIGEECCSTYTMNNGWVLADCGSSGLTTSLCIGGDSLIAGYGGQLTLTGLCCPQTCTACPADEDVDANCGHTLHVTFTGESTDAGDYEMTLTGGVWTWENPAISVDCLEIGDPFIDPPAQKWFMVLYDQETLGVQYVFYADPCACPPTDISKWTNFVDGSHHAGELTLIEYV